MQVGDRAQYLGDVAISRCGFDLREALRRFG